MPLLTPTPDGLLRDGRPHLLVSGAMHYFRVHPDLWRDRMRRIVAMGCNTLETYVAWNFHAPDPESVDFTGWRDLGRYLDLAAEHGLDVIVRPGPYICAEWEGGGLPGWLMRDPSVRLRCSDARYEQAVDVWFDHLVPVIAQRQASRGGRVVAVQVENEYGSFGDDRAHLEHLRDGLRARDIDELLVTSDGPSHAHLAGGTVDGAWATVNFGSRALEALDLATRELPGQPQMCMEFWNGWFDHWGEPHHTRDAADAARELDDMLRCGMHVNFYMAHGGTNFGLWAGANHEHGQLQPTVTSYDYDSPIAEDGTLAPKFHAFREVIARYRELPPLDEQLAQLGLDAQPARLEPRRVTWTAMAPMRSLSTWAHAGERWPHPPAFEDMGLERGMQLLRRPVEFEHTDEDGIAPLVLHELADRATLFVAGRRLARVDGTGQPVEVALDGIVDLVPEVGPGVRRGVLEVELLVENRARVNFGPLVGQRKGILGGIWHGVRFLNGWQAVALPLEQLGHQLADEATDCHEEPSVPLVGAAEVFVHPSEAGRTAFLDTSGCGRGVV